MSNLALWSPPSPFAELDNWLKDAFGALWGSSFGPDWINADFRPAAEVARDGDDAVVRVELPGVDVDKDVNVEVDNGQLVIHGERRDELPRRRTAARCASCGTARSAGRSRCRRTSRPMRSRRRTTRAC